MMKKTYLLIGILITLLSCQHNEEQDWKHHINSVILNYNRIAEIDLVKKDSVNGGEEIITFFKNENSLSKVIVDVDYGLNMNFNSVIYTLDNVPIYSEFKGYSPYLYKGEKKKSDPIGKLLFWKTYYKSSTNAIRESKELIVYDFINIESKKIEFKSVDFTEEEIEDSNKEYNKIMESYKELKNIKNR